MCKSSGWYAGGGEELGKKSVIKKSTRKFVIQGGKSRLVYIHIFRKKRRKEEH